MNNLVPGRSAWMLRAGFAALALILVALLAACGGDAVPGEDADTEAPAPEATDRVRAPAPGSPAMDREILVTFYNALDGPNWEDSGNWLTDAPLGEWYGVTTDDNGRVIWLSIEGNGLTGKIPPELGNLASLQYLRLRGEGLSGGIPPELGNLKQLYELYIYGTQLGGPIPPELGNIRLLSELHLIDNELSGEIPPWLGNLSNLIRLDLRGNQLSGEIPAEWGNLYRLESLDLSGNQLSGAIPSGLGNIDTLERLTLHENQLSGEIPSELGNLDNLKSLTLHENQLSGEIPSEVWNMLEREVEIEIHGNQFPCLTGGLRHLYIEQRANC